MGVCQVGSDTYGKAALADTARPDEADQRLTRARGRPRPEGVERTGPVVLVRAGSRQYLSGHRDRLSWRLPFDYRSGTTCTQACPSSLGTARRCLGSSREVHLSLDGQLTALVQLTQVPALKLAARGLG
jgi:hypothetical protein